MTAMDNGPDRSLGLWRLHGGTALMRNVGGELREADASIGALRALSSKSVGELLENGNIPIDTTAKREAIRAGWREVGGKWVKDGRPLEMCSCVERECRPGPACYELSAKYRGEWPQDEPQAEAPAPKPTKAPTAYRAAKAALREACDEARRQGREEERRRQAAQEAKACVLKRLSDGVQREEPCSDPNEAAVAILLGAAIAQAKRSGVDLSALAERMASGVEVKQ